MARWCLGARGFCWRSAGGARPRCGVGHGGFAAVGGRARCRVHVQHPWPPPWGVLPPPASVGVAAPSLGAAASCFGGGVLGSALPPGSFLHGGLWWLWWVVCDLYSGCEHLCCLRAPPVVSRALGLWCGCGGRGGPVACCCCCCGGGLVGRVFCCVVLWGIRWMPWHQELMKDVAACDMPRGVGERALIRGCPNGGTRPGLCWATII